MPQDAFGLARAERCVASGWKAAAATAAAEKLGPPTASIE